MAIAELPPITVNEAGFIRQAKQICHDLMIHRPAIYWVDFLVSITLSWTAIFVYIYADWFSPIQIAAFLVAGLMLYRSSVFTHELAHMAPTRFRAFRIVWNMLFGCPFLMPSVLYTDHRVHHTSQTFGTDGDGEYYPLAHTSITTLVFNMLVVFIVPFLPVIRFGILGPLSLLHPSIRKLVWQRATSLGTLNPAYRRAAPDEHERRALRWQEAGCFVTVATLVTLLATGTMTWTTFWMIYSVYVLAVFVNNVRVLGAHRYVGPGTPITFVEQMLDSTTIPGGPWSALWAPLGMRFHALHHLFPAMPYHEMEKAHYRLMEQLPPNSPYHQTLVRSLPESVVNLVRAVRQHESTLTPVGR